MAERNADKKSSKGSSHPPPSEAEAEGRRDGPEARGPVPKVGKREVGKGDERPQH